METERDLLTGMDAVVAAGGELGLLTRAFDWSRTPLGPISEWPQSLQSALSICLSSRFPIVMYWGPELTVLYNDAYSQILGHKHPWALGKPCRVVWAEIWDTIGPMLEEVVATGMATWSDDLELRLERSGEPEETYFSFSFSPVRVESGEVGGVFTAVVETTHRVMSERRLRVLSSLGETAFGGRSIAEAGRLCIEAMRDTRSVPFALLYLADESGQASLLAGTGLAPESRLRPKAVRLADPGEVWPLGEVAETGSPAVVELASPDLAPDGRWPADVAPRRAIVVPIQAGDLVRTAFLVAGMNPLRPLDADYRRFFELLAHQVGRAITDARALEAERERAEALAELDRAKTVFFSNVSHELRTPLTLLLGPLEQALQELPPEQRDGVAMAHRNAMRLLRLVNTLLDFSRIEARRVEPTYEPVDLPRLTMDLASAFRAAVEQAGLELRVNTPSLPEPAFVDVEMWEKIVLNLVSNAFKFTLVGSITVSTRLAGDHFELQVSDTGSGIAGKELPRLFERFHRVHGARSRTQEGSGIGLALVRELVDLHGGTVYVRSRLGRGTTFVVSIPRGRAHLTAGRMGAPRTDYSTTVGAAPFVEEAARWLPGGDAREGPTWSRGGGFPNEVAAGETAGARVLVADDNADMRRYLTSLLAPHWAVTAVADGRAALETALESPPDLILTDVMMAGMDGFELLRHLREDERTRQVPVVMLSARAGSEATVEGMEAGADDYLVKPFVARELVARVRANLDLSRMRRFAQSTIDRYEAAERSLERALTSLTAVAEHIREDVSRETLFARLSETVARLVDARLVVFWRLRGQELVAVQEAFGVDPALLEKVRIKVSPAGEEIADRIVFRGESFNGPIDDGDRFAAYRNRLRRRGVRTAMGVQWRAGDEPLGMLWAYDSQKPGGFTREDVWVARIASLAAALVFEHRRAADRVAELTRSESDRLVAEARRLEDLEKIKSEFLSLASHELRGPVSVLGGYLSMIEEGSLGQVGPQVQAVLPILNSKIKEIRSLIDQLLETARLEDHRLALQCEVLDLRQVVKQVVASMRPLVPPSHTLCARLPRKPVPIYGDSNRLANVIANLVDNAIRYSPAGGPIVVHGQLRAGEHSAVITVSDRGIGIARADLPRLFTRFGRLVTPENSHISGTGLGLYLSAQLVEMHGGEISVESEPGCGSTFSLSLPLADATGDHRELPAPCLPPPESPELIQPPDAPPPGRAAKQIRNSGPIVR